MHSQVPLRLTANEFVETFFGPFARELATDACQSRVDTGIVERAIEPSIGIEWPPS